MALFDDVQQKVLDNGLEILVREDHSAPVVALNFFVRVGSLNEDGSIAGWSHGIEHMLFKGTERRGPGDIAREIANAGGETNAGTGYESTNYYIILPSENFETAVDIHADVLRNSTFDEHELEKERQVLIKENEMYRDRPSGFGHTWESLLAEAFTTHRYQRPIGGPDENLLRVGRDDILSFKETYYVPNNITYVVVGDVQADEVFRVLDEKLGGWPRRELVPDTSPLEPPQKAFRHRDQEGDVEKSYVKIGFHIPQEVHPDTDALLVLAHILGSGRSSRLYQRVREEKGLILSCSVLETTGREPGYLVVEFSAEPGKVDEALTEVFRQILGFQVEPVTPDELARTLRAIQTDTIYTLETMEGQAQMLGHYALLGDHRLAGTYLDRMARVSPKRIQDVARRYLNLEQSTVHGFGPNGKPADASPRQNLYDRLRAAVADSLGRSDQRAGAGTAEARVLRATGRLRDEVEAVDLDSGARVLLQTDGRLPLVALSTYLPVGSGLEGEDRAGVSRLAQSCMLKGAGGKSAAEIAETLDRMGARLRPMSTRDVSGFSLGMMRDEVDPALELYRAVLTRPDFPEEAVTRERDRALAELAALRDDTVQFTVAEFYRLIFPDHAYGRPVLGTQPSLTKLGRSDLAEWHREAYSPRRMVLSVVGDFDRNTMLRQLEAITENLPGADGAGPPISPVTPPSEPVRNDLHKDVNQAVVVLGYPGTTLDSPDRYALDVWDTILSGMGNRLFTRLRDEQHLCYFTGAFVSSFVRGGAVGAYIGTGPEQVEKATAALIEELERTRHELPTDEEMDRARNNLAGSHLVGMQTRMSWAGTYARDEILGLGWEEALRYVEAIRRVSPEMVRECAEKYVDPSRLTVAVLRPSGDSVSVETVEA
jgi:zinc protease